MMTTAAYFNNNGLIIIGQEKSGLGVIVKDTFTFPEHSNKEHMIVMLPKGFFLELSMDTVVFIIPKHYILSCFHVCAYA